MTTFFERLSTWSAIEVLALAGIVAAVLLVPIAIFCWRSVCLRRADLALRMAMLEKGYAVEEVERLLRAASGGDASDEAIAELTYALGSKEMPADVVEEVLEMAASVDQGTQKTISAAVTSLIAGAYDEGAKIGAEQIVATVRGLCARAGKAAATRTPP